MPLLPVAPLRGAGRTRPVRSRSLVMLSLFLLLATPAPALLLEVDLLAAGDGLITRDTDTGLDWLDVSATAGVSYANVAAGAGGWLAAGFRHATFAEICGLAAAAGVAPVSCAAPSAGAVVPGSAGLTLTALLGVTQDFESLPSQSFVATRGHFDDGAGPLVGRASFLYDRLAGNSPVLISSNQDHELSSLSSIGSFLVRAVPEPSGAALLLLGGMCAWLRLRARRARRPAAVLAAAEGRTRRSSPS